jgi:transcriptional regulator with XRE-family HTH domain
MRQIFPNGFLPYHLVMEKRQPREILAANLTRIMEHRELGQHGLKRLSGLPQVTIGRIMRGDTAAQVDTLEPLARALGFEPWMLLYPDLDPEDAPSVGGRGKTKFSFSPAAMERLLRLFDSLTAVQQDDTLKSMAELAGTNKDLVRELTKRATFAKALEIPRIAPAQAAAVPEKEVIV